MIQGVKDFDVCILIDIYGGLLTEKQRDAVVMYHELDYSLSEIAENLSITRQAANDAVKRGEARLREFEAALGVREKYARTEAVIDRLMEGDDAAKSAARELMDIWGDTDGI